MCAATRSTTTQARTQAALLIAGAALLACACYPGPADARDKTDVVALRNGDKVTGEIKKLEYGLLELSTDHMGTVKIEWDQVASVESTHSFDVERIGGDRVYGSLTGGAAGVLVVREAEAPQSVPLRTVTRLSGVESRFFDRVNGTLSVGYNYAKSSDISIGNINLAAQYDAPRLRSTLDVSANRTSSPGAESTDQESIQSTVQFLSEKPRFWVMLNTLESNEELGIEQRLQSGAAVARYLRQSPDSELTGLAGLTVNAERTTGEDSRQQSIEAVIGAQWRVFRFSDPEVSLSAGTALYPSLTESGRYRGSLNVTLARDLIKDLTLSLSVFGSYDSDPPQAEGATDVAKEDYSIVTSFGYKF
jgi:hypothetical protein